MFLIKKYVNTKNGPMFLMILNKAFKTDVFPGAGVFLQITLIMILKIIKKCQFHSLHVCLKTEQQHFIFHRIIFFRGIEASACR